MNVKELKEKLADLPDDLELYIWDDEWSSFDDDFDLRLGTGTFVEVGASKYKEIVHFQNDSKSGYNEGVLMSHGWSCDEYRGCENLEEMRIGVFE